jgi:hypothetical protein
MAARSQARGEVWTFGSQRNAHPFRKPHQNYLRRATSHTSREPIGSPAIGRMVSCMSVDVEPRLRREIPMGQTPFTMRRTDTLLGSWLGVSSEIICEYKLNANGRTLFANGVRRSVMLFEWLSLRSGSGGGRL